MEVMRRSDIIRNERGMAVVYLAMIILFLIFMAAITIDLGYMYVTKTQLQNAADAGALAGAGVLRTNVCSSITLAKNAAKKFAESNSAAGRSLETGVSLDETQNEITSSNDITVGYWDGSNYFDGATYISCNPPHPLNAVKVRVRRTAGSNLGPVNLFFAKLFSWSSMGAGAEAIADQEPAKVLPIIVNEYWMAEASGDRPYGNDQDYPNSFVRQTNVDGSPSKVFGKIFGIMGAKAEDNVPNNEAKGSSNVNSFVYLDARNSSHSPATPWYVLNNDASTSPDCASCSTYFTATALTTGDISQNKFDTSIGYLFNGYPFMPPATVLEPARATPYNKHYPADNVYPIPTSSCPYATIAYFPMSGNQPLNKVGPSGQYFNDAYPPGTKIVTLVYDGTFVPQPVNASNPAASQPNAVTAVGYVLIQIDGYSSTQPKQLNLDTTTPTFTARGNKTDDGNTMYGHAVSNIITPGPCPSDIINEIQALQYAGAGAKLVK